MFHHAALVLTYYGCSWVLKWKLTESLAFSFCDVVICSNIWRTYWRLYVHTIWRLHIEICLNWRQSIDITALKVLTDDLSLRWLWKCDITLNWITIPFKTTKNRCSALCSNMHTSSRFVFKFLLCGFSTKFAASRKWFCVILHIIWISSWSVQVLIKPCIFISKVIYSGYFLKTIRQICL